MALIYYGSVALTFTVLHYPRMWHASQTGTEQWVTVDLNRYQLLSWSKSNLKASARYHNNPLFPGSCLGLGSVQCEHTIRILVVVRKANVKFLRSNYYKYLLVLYFVSFSLLLLQLSQFLDFLIKKSVLVLQNSNLFSQSLVSSENIYLGGVMKDRKIKKR